MKQIIFLLFLLTAFQLKGQSVLNKTHRFDGQNQLIEIRYGNGARVSFTYDRNMNRLTRRIIAVSGAAGGYMSIAAYGSLLSYAQVSWKMAGDSLETAVGYTDEHGMLHTALHQAFSVNDTLILRAMGYADLRIPIDADMVMSDSRLPVPMAKRADYASIGNVINPSVKVISAQGVLSQVPSVQLELGGLNVLQYQILSDTVWTTVVPVGGLVNYTLTKQDMNEISVRFISAVDTVVITKPFYWLTASMTPHVMAFTLHTPPHLFGTEIWSNETFLGVADAPVKNFLLRRHANHLRFIHLGYRDTLMITEKDTAFNLMLTPLPETNESYTFSFINHTGYWRKQNMTLFNSGFGTVGAERIFANFDTLGLLPLVPAYGLHKNVSSDSLKAYLVFDVRNYPNLDSLYFGVWENGAFRKIFPSDFAANGITYMPALQLLKYENIIHENVRFCLFKQRPPVPLSGTGADTLQAVTGHWVHHLLSSLYADPDSIAINAGFSDRPKAISASFDTTKLQVILGDTLKIRAKPCQTGIFPITFTVAHDSLAINDTVWFESLPIEDASKLFSFAANPVCPEELDIVSIASIDSVKYAVKNIAADTLLTAYQQGNGGLLSLIFDTQISLPSVGVIVKDTLTGCELLLSYTEALNVLPGQDTLALPDSIIACYGSQQSIYLEAYTCLVYDSIGVRIDSLGTNTTYAFPHNPEQSGFYTYHFVAKNSYGCKSDTMKVVVEQAKKLSDLPSEMTRCQGDSIVIRPNFITDEPIAYEWRRNSTLLSYTGNRYAEYAVDSARFIVKVTNLRTGCLVWDTIQVNVQPKIRNNGFVINRPLICSTDTTRGVQTLVGTLPTGGDNNSQYQWILTADTLVTASFNWFATTKDATLPPISQSVFVKRYVNAGACTNETPWKKISWVVTPDITMNFDSLIASRLNDSTLYLCDKYQNFDVWFDFGTGSGKLWFKSPSATDFIAIGIGRRFTLGAKGKYMYVAENQGLCTDTVKFELIRGLPFIHDIQPTTPTFCFEKQLNVIGPRADATYKWFKRKNESDISWEYLNEGISTVVYDSCQVFVETTYQGCADSSQFLTLFKLPVPQAEIVGAERQADGKKLIRLCGNGRVELISKNGKGNWYFIEPNQTLTLINENSDRAVLLNDAHGTVLLEMSSYDSCRTSDTAIVVRDMPISAQISGLEKKDTLYCYEEGKRQFRVRGNLPDGVLWLIKNARDTVFVYPLKKTSFTFDISEYVAFPDVSLSIVYGYPYQHGCEGKGGFNSKTAFTVKLNRSEDAPYDLKLKHEYFVCDTIFVSKQEADTVFAKELLIVDILKHDTLYRKLVAMKDAIVLSKIPNLPIGTTLIWKFGYFYSNPCRKVVDFIQDTFRVYQINTLTVFEDGEEHLASNFSGDFKSGASLTWRDENGKILAKNQLRIEKPDYDGFVYLQLHTGSCFVETKFQISKRPACEITAFPNPVKNDLKVLINGKICNGKNLFDKYTFKICDNLGRLVQESGIFAKQSYAFEAQIILKSDLPAGNYILKIEKDGDLIETIKFVKE